MIISETRMRLRTRRGLICLLAGVLLATSSLRAPATGGPTAPAVPAQAKCLSQDYNGCAGPSYLLPGWGNVPWAAPQYYTTIQLGDLDGDGKDELIGREGSGIAVHKFNSSLGQWQPVLDASGTILRGPLPDTEGWDHPQYYLTIRLADVDGDRRKELVVRGANGINVFRFTNATPKPGSTLPAGGWQQLTTGGPFTDDEGWKDPTTYTTIQLADVDGQPGEELVGRDANRGLRVHKWNGAGWDRLAGMPNLDNRHGFNSESQYKTIQFADLDGRPGKELLFREADGLHAAKYQPGTGGGAWVTVIDGDQPFSDGEGFEVEDKYWTIQTADLDGDGVAEVLGRGENGIMVLKYASASPTSGTWDRLTEQGPWCDEHGSCDERGWNKGPQYYKTIQLADINGDKKAELLGRGFDGMHAFQWDAGAKIWTEITSASAVPALADDPWAKGEQYYTTIQTGNVDGDAKGQAELLARGTTGVRTWFWRNNTWTRSQPYGSFPGFTGDELTAYRYLRPFIGVDVPEFRDIYTDPTTDPDPDTLNEYQGKIAATCMDPLPGTAPQYKSCTPPEGSDLTQPAWTAVANQIIAELFWAQQVIDHFTMLEGIRTELFLTQNSEFPSIADDIKLSGEAKKAASVDYFSLAFNFLANIFKLFGSIIGPEGAPLTITGNAIAAGMSAASFSPTGGDPFSGKFEHTYAEMQQQIATIQQRTQTALLAQKHHVTGDYGLLRTVGDLVGSQVWTLDEGGTLSASRYGFTKWVYQAFLPLLWDKFRITNCKRELPDSQSCTPPDSGPYVVFDNLGLEDFTALFDKGTECTFGVDYIDCNYKRPPDKSLLDVVFTPVSPQCTYTPGTTNAWIYGQCTLGIGPEIFDDTSGWKFTIKSGSPVIPNIFRSASGSCHTICFRAPGYYLGRLDQLPRGTVVVAGNGHSNSISTDHRTEMRLALDGGNSAQDRFNRYFVAAQLGLLAAPGANQGARASRLECYGLDFNQVRLSNGNTLSPIATLDALLEQSRQAARGGNPADLEVLAKLLRLLTGDDQSQRCSTGGKLP